MKPFTRLLACAALLLSSSSQALGADAPTGCKYVNVASVPVQYTGPSLELTMEGSLNGTPAKLLVDTGAFETLLTRTGTEARGMALRNSGHTASGIGGWSRIYLTNFKEFRAGPATTKNGTLRVIQDFGAAPSYDGIAGAPFLLQADLEFSLAEKKIRFFRPLDCKGAFLAYWDPQATVLPFTFSGEQNPNPHFTVLLNGTKLSAKIDSGSTTTAVTLAGAKRAGLKLDAPGVQRAGYSVGVGDARVARWVTTFDKLELGAETINNAQVGVIDTELAGVDLVLGVDFLRSHRVLFAMSQEKLYISYIGGDPLGQRRGIEPWMQQEADGGNTDAQMMLSVLHGAGRGVPRDPVQSKAWLERAAAGGNAFANFHIGRGHMPRRQYALAAQHLRLGLDKLPGDRTAALWLYLARLHLGEGEAARADLAQAFARDDRDQWPNPVARHFLGKLSEDELLEEARDDKARARGQACMAKTMMGEHAAALGDLEKAKSIMFHRPECGPAPPPADKAS